MSVKKHFKRLGLSLVSLLIIVSILLPLLLIIFSSFQYEEALIGPNFKFEKMWFTLDNYRYIFTGEIPKSPGGDVRSRITQSVRKLPITVFNSFFVAICTALVNLIFCSGASYIFAYKKFKGKKIIYLFVLLSRIIPPIAVIVPFFTIIKAMGLLDTKLSLIFIYSAMTLPISLFIFRTYMEKIPKEISDAALIDGCGDFKVLYKIIIPISRPGLIAGTIFAFFLSYIEFRFALGLTQSYKSRTVPVLLSGLAASPDLSYSMLCSTLILAMIPSIAVGLFVRKYLTGMVPQLK